MNLSYNSDEENNSFVRTSGELFSGSKLWITSDDEEEIPLNDEPIEERDEGEEDFDEIDLNDSSESPVAVRKSTAVIRNTSVSEIVSDAVRSELKYHPYIVVTELLYGLNIN